MAVAGAWLSEVTIANQAAVLLGVVAGVAVDSDDEYADVARSLDSVSEG